MLVNLMDRATRYFAYAEEYFVLVEGDLENFSEEDVVRYVRILERYNFSKRSKTDPKHPNTRKDHLQRKRSDNKTPVGLARATLRLMDPKYNAQTANNIKNSLVKLTKEKHPKLF